MRENNRKCPECGKPYLRVGVFGEELFDNDVYHVICDNCDFYCPKGTNDYGEAFIEFDYWLKDNNSVKNNIIVDNKENNKK